MSKGSEQSRWMISRGEPGPYKPRPGQWAAPGTVLRAELWESEERPFPADAPGYRRLDERRVSAIVTTVSEDPPVYCRDEDGDQPSDLIGVDGWLFVIHVRPATAEEAADILASEAVAARCAQLEQRRRNLFGRGFPGDGEVPAADAVGDLTGTVAVPYGAELRRGVHEHWPDDEIRVNAARGEVWALYYNGMDGDDWSRNNYGRSFIAVRYPLTAERAELINELRAEYEISTWKAGGVGEAAAHVLILAGWDYRRAVSKLGRFALESEEDARVLLSRPQEQWEEAGWIGYHSYGSKRFTPADAALLADAGISYSHALQRQKAGHTTAAEILSARRPHIPDGAGRIVVAPQHPRSSAAVTSDPAFARDWLDRRVDCWNADRLEVVAGVRPAHVASKWSLWDDGVLVVGEWMMEYYPAVRSAERPEMLPEAAVQALNLVTSSRTRVDPEVWRLLLDATGHQAHELASDSHKGYQWGSSKVLRRHDFTTPGGVRSLWEAWGDEGGMSGGEGDYAERSEVYADKAAAQRSYTAWELS
ncbi:hypothetical protein ACWDZ4_20040 [Streptomyces sp. NPDC003016]